jgi:hypothetical protein
MELRNKIMMIKENQLKELDTMVNLGSEFYVQAKVYVKSIPFGDNLLPGLTHHVYLSMLVLAFM